MLARQVFLITEFMEGGDLGRRIRRDKAVPRQTSWYQQGRFIALGIARGLLYLHSRGIVWFHCKPGNVLLNGSGDVAMIADFGLARILEATYIMTHQVSNFCLALCIIFFVWKDSHRWQTDNHAHEHLT